MASKYDVFAQAGGKFKAVEASFPVTADTGRWFFGYSAAAVAVIVLLALAAVRFALGAPGRAGPVRA